MNQAAVKQKLLPAASGPVLARLVDAAEFKDMTDLRIAYERRGNELLALREDHERTTGQVRQFQDLYAQATLDKQKLRGELILAEHQIAAERATRESLVPKLYETLLAWAQHSRDCDTNCVAVIELQRGLKGETLLRTIGDVPQILVPAEELLHEAMDDRNETLLRVVAESLAASIRGDVRRVHSLCGHDLAACDYCWPHETCVEPGEPCPECLHEDEGGRRQDMRHEARIAEGRS